MPRKKAPNGLAKVVYARVSVEQHQAIEQETSRRSLLAGRKLAQADVVREILAEALTRIERRALRPWRAAARLAAEVH